MKTRIIFGLWFVFVASCIAVRANDNPAQSAARAALEQKLKELDNLQNWSTPDTSSGAAVKQPGKSATNVTVVVQTKAVTPQAATAATASVAAVVAVAPVATAAPTKTQPAAAPSTSKPTPALAAERNSSPPVNSQIHPAPVTRSWDVQPGESVTNATATVRAKPVAPQAAMVANAPVAAVVTIAPVATAAPTMTQPAAALVMPRPTPALGAIKTSTPPAKTKPTNEIVTTFGTVYKHALVEKVESDGLIISYWTSSGGLGLTKVYFEDLPYELRQQYKKSNPPKTADIGSRSPLPVSSTNLDAR